MGGRVEGKVALITGAARGQGRSHAIRLAEEGADVIAIDITEQIDGIPYPTGTAEEMNETVASVEKLGRRIVPIDADVRDFPDLSGKVDQAVAEFGRLDIVAANAGIGGTYARAHEMPETMWQQMLDVNLTGTWHTVKAAVPHLLAGGRGGAIVLTSSALGLRAYANIGHYVAAKHGVTGLMKTLANELGPDGIRVNSLHPTLVDTPMIMNEPTFRLFRPELDAPGRDDFAVVGQAMNTLPVPWVDPVDVSNVLVFLVSDEARYVTGAALPIDAGSLVK